MSNPRPKPPVLVLVLAVLAGAAACGQPAVVRAVALDLAPALDRAIAVPLDADLRNPVVTVLVDGRPGRFAVDTGADVTALDRAFADRLQLARRPYRGTINADRADRAALRVESVACVARLELGAARVRDVHLQILDLAHLGRGYDGILGQDFLGGFALLLDAEFHELHLIPGDPIAYLSDVYADGVRFFVLPLEVDGRRPRLALTSHAPGASSDLEMLVDTGATFSALPRAVAEAHGLELEAIARVAGVAAAAEREVRRIDSFALGPFRASMRATVIEGERGLLGFELLREFVTVIDVPGRRLMLALEPERRAGGDGAVEVQHERTRRPAGVRVRPRRVDVVRRARDDRAQLGGRRRRRRGRGGERPAGWSGNGEA